MSNYVYRGEFDELKRLVTMMSSELNRVSQKIGVSRRWLTRWSAHVLEKRKEMVGGCEEQPEGMEAGSSSLGKRESDYVKYYKKNLFLTT